MIAQRQHLTRNLTNAIDIIINKMVIAKKQDLINDNDLTIAKTAGLQDLLDTQTASIVELKAGGGGSEFKPCFSCRMPNSQPEEIWQE